MFLAEKMQPSFHLHWYAAADLQLENGSSSDGGGKDVLQHTAEIGDDC